MSSIAMGTRRRVPDRTDVTLNQQNSSMTKLTLKRAKQQSQLSLQPSAMHIFSEPFSPFSPLSGCTVSPEPEENRLLQKYDLPTDIADDLEIKNLVVCVSYCHPHRKRRCLRVHRSENHELFCLLPPRKRRPSLAREVNGEENN